MIDCHVHVFEPRRFPYAADATYRPHGAEAGTPRQLERVLDAQGFGHALIVGPNSGYGLDNRCLLDALARGAGRYKGMAVVRNEASRGELQELQARGVIGVTFNVALLGLNFYRNIAPLLERLRELDLWADVQVEGNQLVALAPLLQDSGAKLAFDHCGRPLAADVGAGVGQAGFQALLKLAQTRRACVKLSGFTRTSRARHPHDDMRPYVQALLQAYTPQALVWGSDWPFLRLAQRPDHAGLLALLERYVPDAEARRTILCETPRRLFGFPA